MGGFIFSIFRGMVGVSEGFGLGVCFFWVIGNISRIDFGKLVRLICRRKEVRENWFVFGLRKIWRREGYECCIFFL